MQRQTDVDAMAVFRELTHNIISSDVFPEFDMLLGRLAQLCGRKYHGDQHLWLLYNSYACFFEKSQFFQL